VDTASSISATTEVTREVVRRYNLEMWNRRRFDLGYELLGEQVIRNGPDSREVLSREQSIDRVRTLWASVEHVEFRLLQLIAEGELCTIVYQADIRLPGGKPDAIASIEVFRVVDGRIVEVWNNTHDHGRWPEPEGDAP
jgi:predicted SnoaL-like aldol condensation-catalyzing enzyme